MKVRFVVAVFLLPLFGQAANTRPVAPSDLRISGCIEDTKRNTKNIKLAWKDNSKDETSFNIYRRSSLKGDSSWTQVGQIKQTNPKTTGYIEWSDPTKATFPRGTQIEYQVSAGNKYGECFSKISQI